MLLLQISLHLINQYVIVRWVVYYHCYLCLRMVVVAWMMVVVAGFVLPLRLRLLVVVVVVGLVSGWTVRTQLQDAPEGRATGEAPPNLDAGTTMH